MPVVVGTAPPAGCVLMMMYDAAALLQTQRATLLDCKLPYYFKLCTVYCVLRASRSWKDDWYLVTK